MASGQWFWILYVICIVLSLWSWWPTQANLWKPVGGILVIYILLGLLGWAVFGPPLR